MERKLAAILSADVVGFAGLVARDEEATLAKLEILMRDTIQMLVEANRGRVFKTLGDGVLAEFTSTIEAMKCAINIQSQADHDALQSAEENPLQLRIGVSVGDVVVQGEDLLGDGVNMAARLQAMADPGGIAVSGEVMAQVRGKMTLDLQDCGYQKLKENDAPVHVFKTRQQSNQVAGLFDFGETAAPAPIATGSCLCNAVRFEINAPPISTGYCHCRICQKFTGSAMSTWTAFPAASVHCPNEEPHYFASSPIAERGFCQRCGSSLTYRLIKPNPAGYLIIFTPILDKPETYAPTVHGGIESKLPWLDIMDDLPRTACAESRSLQAAWSSVGQSDPTTWGPIDKTK